MIQQELKSTERKVAIKLLFNFMHDGQINVLLLKKSGF